jgi:hypothetical protein
MAADVVRYKLGSRHNATGPLRTNAHCATPIKLIEYVLDFGTSFVSGQMTARTQERADCDRRAPFFKNLTSYFNNNKPKLIFLSTTI